MVGSLAVASLSTSVAAQDCPYPLIMQSGVCTVVSSVPPLTEGPRLGDITIPTVDIVKPAVAVKADEAAVVQPDPEPARALCRFVDGDGNEVFRDC